MIILQLLGGKKFFNVNIIRKDQLSENVFVLQIFALATLFLVDCFFLAEFSIAKRF